MLAGIVLLILSSFFWIQGCYEYLKCCMDLAKEEFKEVQIKINFFNPELRKK